MSSLQASFESLPLDELFAFLAANRSTGLLAVAGDQQCSVWFVDGAVSGAAQAGDVEIGDALVRAGAVTVDQWTVAVGTDDVSAGLATQPEVDVSRVRSLLQERLVDALFPVFLLPETPYDFHEGHRNPFGDAFAWDARELATHARARLDDWRAIAAGIPSLDAIVELEPFLPDASSGITIPPGEWALVSRIDGRRSVSELVQLTGMTAYEVCSTVLRLRDAGVVRLTGADAG